MSEIRFTRDDLIPYLESQGVAAFLRKWLPRNPNDSVMRWLISDWSSLQEITNLQLKQLISDLTLTKKLEWADMSGDSLPSPIVRPAKPSGMAIVSGVVSITAPIGAYDVRFYVDGGLQKSGQITSATLLELGAVAGNKIQACLIPTADIFDADGVTLLYRRGTVGWWSKVTVS